MSSKTVELECVAASGIFKIDGYGRLDFTNGRARVKAEDIPKLEASLDGNKKKLWNRKFGLVGTFSNPGRNLAPDVVRDDMAGRQPAAIPASQQTPKGADFTEFEDTNEDLILKAQELAEREEAEAQARLAAQQANQAPPAAHKAPGKGGKGKVRAKVSPAA